MSGRTLRKEKKEGKTMMRMRSLVQATGEVVGYKTCRRGKKGTAWWTQEIKITVEEKRKAYKEMLQRNMPEEVREQLN